MRKGYAGGSDYEEDCGQPVQLLLQIFQESPKQLAMNSG